MIRYIQNSSNGGHAQKRRCQLEGSGFESRCRHIFFHFESLSTPTCIILFDDMYCFLKGFQFLLIRSGYFRSNIDDLYLNVIERTLHNSQTKDIFRIKGFRSGKLAIFLKFLKRLQFFFFQSHLIFMNYFNGLFSAVITFQNTFRR